MLRMKAAILHGVNDLRLEDLNDPRPDPDEVIVQINACGICGSDVNMWQGSNDEGVFPIVLGHEWIGEVVEVGSAAGRFKVGDRVVSEVTVGCGHCANCKNGFWPEVCGNAEVWGFRAANPGGMAHYHKANENRLHHVPDDMTDEQAALIEPLSISYHGIWDCAGGVRSDDRVAVFGAGPIGMLAMLVCKSAGAPVVMVEPQPGRRQLATDLGADHALDPTADGFAEKIRACTQGRGPSLIIECSGNQAARAATLEVVASQGRIVVVGITANRKVPIDVDQLIFKSARIIGSEGSGFSFSRSMQFIAQCPVDVTGVITHRLGLDDLMEGFELGAGRNDACKVLLQP